jgi:hypothetical protein
VNRKKTLAQIFFMEGSQREYQSPNSPLLRRVWDEAALPCCKGRKIHCEAWFNLESLLAGRPHPVL